MAGPISVEFFDTEAVGWRLAHQSEGQVRVTLAGVALTFLVDHGTARVTINPDNAPGLDWTEVSASGIQGRLSVRGSAWLASTEATR